MNKITDITRRDILDLIQYGITDVLDTSFITWSGRLGDLAFLERLYDLKKLPSYDSRFSTAEDDIWQHTVNNDDWENDWIFTDSRFKLTAGNDDEYLLKFICEIFHPAVRKEQQDWQLFLDKINQLLNADGYELYERNHISGRSVYGYREIDHIETDSPNEPVFAKLKIIGNGSYATVSKFFDIRYDRWLALKSAKTDLNDKEIARFKREFDDMKKLHSPYIVEVYAYDDSKKRYTMELMDDSLEQYIIKNNNNLDSNRRYKMVLQLFNAFHYIHSKGLLHRDVCPKNILIKKYDDAIILKISDFGLVKENLSDLTSDSTDIKGYYNDPALRIEGFKNYSLIHEIYALTQVIVFIMTGKSNFDKISDSQLRAFLLKGTNPNKEERFQSLDEMKKEFMAISLKYNTGI